MFQMPKGITQCSYSAMKTDHFAHCRVHSKSEFGICAKWQLDMTVIIMLMYIVANAYIIVNVTNVSK